MYVNHRVGLKQPFTVVKVDNPNWPRVSNRRADRALARNGGQDSFPCGFAWVTVYDVKLSTKLSKEMAKLGFSKAHGDGIQLWNPSKSPVQNVDIKLEGAEAYAGLLRHHGFKAYANSRWD